MKNFSLLFSLNAILAVAGEDTMVDDRGHGPEIKAEAASYVAELTADLARIARRHGLDTLGYILDMARLEAQNAAGQGASDSSEIN